MRSEIYDIKPQTYAKAIILIRASLRMADFVKGRTAAGFGLRENDFLWINVNRNWTMQIEGKSRSILVLDPFSLLFDAAGDGGFADLIKVSFDRIANAWLCADALAEWLHMRNPDAYNRMIAAGICKAPLESAETSL
jgi:hypothetical protein